MNRELFYTKENIKKYNLNIFQPAKGYRYALDAFLLADFVSGFQFKNAIEFCSGCGIISFLVSRMKQRPLNIEMFEIQENLFNVSLKNLAENQFLLSEISVRNEDVRHILPSFTPDIVYMNPPFRTPVSGRVSNRIEKAFARHEFSLSLEESFQSFINIKDTETRFAIVHLYERKQEILEVAGFMGLFPEKIRVVRSGREKEPVHLMVSFSQNKQDVEREDFSVYDENGRYSAEMLDLLSVREGY